MGRRKKTGRRVEKQAIFNRFSALADLAQKGVEYRTSSTRKKFGGLKAVTMEHIGVGQGKCPGGHSKATRCDICDPPSLLKEGGGKHYEDNQDE